MIVNVNPRMSELDETLNALNFATVAKRVIAPPPSQSVSTPLPPIATPSQLSTQKRTATGTQRRIPPSHSVAPIPFPSLAEFADKSTDKDKDKDSDRDKEKEKEKEKIKDKEKLKEKEKVKVNEKE